VAAVVMVVVVIVAVVIAVIVTVTAAIVVAATVTAAIVVVATVAAAILVVVASDFNYPLSVLLIYIFFYFEINSIHFDSNKVNETFYFLH
jgi:hypothetical protein